MAGDDNPAIYSHEKTLYYLKRIASVTRATTYRRAMRQFGSLLPEGGVLNCGVGPRLEFDETKTIALMPPTHTFSGERHEMTISGMKLVLVHAPGETPDQIYEVLTNYRDAIQFVHDQTIQLMNKGLTPLEIVERVKLPSHLARQSYLHEYYGTVAWSVRAIFEGYLGWFSGNASDLFPLPQDERAKRLVDLAGGEQRLTEKAHQAVAKEDYQWALELTDQLLRINPDSELVRKLRAAALNALGSKQIAATARHYYLTRALEVQNKLHIGMMKLKDKQVVHAGPLDGIFSGMVVNLNPDKSAAIDTVAGFRFPDTGEAFTVHVRRGMAEIRPQFPVNPDITLIVDSTVWKEVVTGFRNPAIALVKDVDKEGGTLEIVKFLNLFKDD
ncbi:MAG: alkyl sulfatase dimerization domain-containing protein [Desulfobacterales bacterium]